MTSKERVLNVLNGKPADRAPVFDLLRNDAAIEYYSGGKLTLDNAERLVYKAVEKVIDATRPSIKYPKKESTMTLPDGRKTVESRWTTWSEPMRFPDEDKYAEYLKKSFIDTARDAANLEKGVWQSIERHRGYVGNIGDTFLFWSISGVGLVNLYAGVGIEQFSYYLCDCPDVISEALEANTEASVKKIRLLDRFTKDTDIRPIGVFLADDIAFKGSTIFSPVYLKKEFFPRLKRVIDACHEVGWKFMFHSDGNLMGILDDLVEAGIDAINPVEIAAGMNIAEIHKRYPDLVMAGGIDVSGLLPYGKPQEVKTAVVKAIEAAEGKIMVGSSTEMHHGVPLENVIALYETAVDYRY